MDDQNIAIQIATNQWELVAKIATKLINQLSDEDLERPVTPGRNTGKYIIGHLIAINDAVPPTLGIGQSEHPELAEIYVKQSDGVATNPKTAQELRQLWNETHTRVTQLIKELPAEQWLGSHSTMTEADLKANPLRNRLSVLMNRTNHFSYHTGQLQLLTS